MESGGRLTASSHKITTMYAHLTDPEIDSICDGLKQPAAMIRYLQAQGFVVARKYNGRPLVSRANFESVMNKTTHHGTSGSGASGTSTGPRWSVPA